MESNILDKIYKAYKDGAKEVYVNPASLNDVDWQAASYSHPFSIAIRGSVHVPLGEVLTFDELTFPLFEDVIGYVARPESKEPPIYIKQTFGVRGK